MIKGLAKANENKARGFLVCKSSAKEKNQGDINKWHADIH